MATQQPEALRLADALTIPDCTLEHGDCMKAGELLRSMHARVQELEQWQDDVRSNSPLLARLERAEKRVAELEARVFTPKIKQTMTEIQFDAIVRLKGLCADKPTCKAARDVFTNGMSMYAAARKHGANEPSVQSTCKSIRAALRDCYIVITGEVPAEGGV